MKECKQFVEAGSLGGSESRRRGYVGTTIERSAGEGSEAPEAGLQGEGGARGAYGCGGKKRESRRGISEEKDQGESVIIARTRTTSGHAHNRESAAERQNEQNKIKSELSLVENSPNPSSSRRALTKPSSG